MDFKISHFLINTEGIIISININIEKNLTNLIERNYLKIIQQLLYTLQNSTLHNCKSRNISVIFIISISKRISRKKKINKYPQKKKVKHSIRLLQDFRRHLGSQFWYQERTSLNRMLSRFVGRGHRVTVARRSSATWWSIEGWARSIGCAARRVFAPSRNWPWAASSQDGATNSGSGPRTRLACPGPARSPILWPSPYRDLLRPRPSLTSRSRTPPFSKTSR